MPPFRRGKGLWLGAILGHSGVAGASGTSIAAVPGLSESRPTTLGAATLLGAAAWLLPAMLLGGQGWIPRASGGVAVGGSSPPRPASPRSPTRLGLVLQRRAGPTYYSQLGFVVVLTGLAAGVVLFGERHGVAVWAGGPDPAGRRRPGTPPARSAG